MSTSGGHKILQFLLSLTIATDKHFTFSFCRPITVSAAKLCGSISGIIFYPCDCRLQDAVGTGAILNYCIQSVVRQLCVCLLHNETVSFSRVR